MLPEFVSSKLRRAAEAFDLVGGYAADATSRRELLRCYATMLRSVTDSTEVSLRLDVLGQTVPVTMRRSDIFTLAEIFHEKQYELHSVVRPGHVIVDAGANIGIAGLWFLTRYPGSTLLAFEPEPTNFRLLCANLAARLKVTLEPAALGATEGHAELHLAGHGAVHSLKEQHGGQVIEVPVKTLDAFLAARDIDHVELLKVDVEGAEMDLLEGLGQRIDGVQVIVGECHERFVDAEKFYRYLGDRGFRVVNKAFFGNGEAEGVHAFEVAR